MSHERVSIDKMHFYWRMTEFPFAPNPFPNFLPIELIFNHDERIFKLNTTDLFWSVMNDMYTLEENVGYLQQGHDLAAPYGLDFLQFIQKNVSNGQKICDIGAGGLYVLNELKKKGYKTLAVDPSKEAIFNGEKMGIDVVSDFYETVDLKKERIEVFIHYDVLEHIRYPDLFLRKHYNELSENGKIVFAVPDCTTAIFNGDISMILAQHINYFDSNSLANMVKRAGFEIEKISKSSFGGVLYCAAKKGKAIDHSRVNQEISINKSITLDFFRKQHQKQGVFEEVMDRATEKNDCIGLYIPLRVFPYLSKYVDYANFIFIDDSKNFQGKYFDGFKSEVRALDEIVSQLDQIIIFSPSFGDSIKNKLINEPNFKGEIVSWDYK